MHGARASIDHGPWTIDPGLWTRGVVALLIGLCSAAAAEAALEFTTDNRQVAFGAMQLGEEKTLAELGTYHNEITCTSSNGRTWYLKMNVISPLSSGADRISLERFTWEVVSTTGRGTLTHPHEPAPFRLSPDLVYVSGADEASGQAVSFQFRYHLKMPDAQLSGIYHTTIRFTLAEVL